MGLLLIFFCIIAIFCRYNHQSLPVLVYYSILYADISVCNLTYIPKLGVTFAIRFDIRYYVWYKVVYIGVASAVKVEMKGTDCFSACGSL